MTDAEIRQLVIDIINDIAPDEDTSALDDDAKLRDQLELDSMDHLSVMTRLADATGREIPERDYPQLLTLRAICDYLD